MRSSFERALGNGMHNVLILLLLEHLLNGGKTKKNEFKIENRNLFHARFIHFANPFFVLHCDNGKKCIFLRENENHVVYVLSTHSNSYFFLEEYTV